MERDKKEDLSNVAVKQSFMFKMAPSAAGKSIIRKMRPPLIDEKSDLLTSKGPATA